MTLDTLKVEVVTLAVELLATLSDAKKSKAVLERIAEGVAKFDDLEAHAARLAQKEADMAPAAKHLDDREGAISSLEKGLADREQRLADASTALDKRKAEFVKAQAEASAEQSASAARVAATLAEAKAALDAIDKRGEEVAARETAAEIREGKLRAAMS